MGRKLNPTKTPEPTIEDQTIPLPPTVSPVIVFEQINEKEVNFNYL